MTQSFGIVTKIKQILYILMFAIDSRIYGNGLAYVWLTYLILFIFLFMSNNNNNNNNNNYLHRSPIHTFSCQWRSKRLNPSVHAACRSWWR